MEELKIVPFPSEDENLTAQLASLLSVSFPCYAADALPEARALLAEGRVALAALSGNTLVGFVGAIPQYNPTRKADRICATGWELHPLAVLPDWQGKGVGAALTARLESEVAARGAAMVYLGSDDEDGRTSLSGVDLFDDPFGKVQKIENFGRHPYAFYEKQGYQIVGVFPDANGPGRPDIWMAKRVGAHTKE